MPLPLFYLTYFVAGVIKAEIETQLKSELKSEAVAQIRSELKSEIETQLKSELKTQLKSDVKSTLTGAVEQDSSNNTDSPHLQAEEQTNTPVSTGPSTRHKEAEPPGSARNAAAKRPIIVSIDDSPYDSRVMGSIISELGYRYINIADPIVALPKLIELKPKLIFLDLVMPIANGYELCKQIRRIHVFKKTPIIIVTSNDGIFDRLRSKITGASGFMAKPIEEKSVKKVIKKYIGHLELASSTTVSLRSHK